jgi:hypothetical protein
VDDLDERLVASWMRQAAAMPFLGGRSDDEEAARTSSWRCPDAAVQDGAHAEAQVVEGVLIHEGEFIQSNAVVADH